MLEGIAAWFDHARKKQRTLHPVGDDTFIIDSERLERKEMMHSKLPEGV